MFYRPADGHGLPHNPFNAIIAPRPIGWISTRCSTGDNLAPYSFFNAVAYVPPQVMFASTGRKDSVRAIRETGVFAVNLVSEGLLHQMNASSAPLARGIDEFAVAGVTKAECETISCPRVLESPATLECCMTQVLQLAGKDNFVILGEVIGVHLRDEFLRDGRYDLRLVRPLARCGYRDYTVVGDQFALNRPDET
jgi:flavin reductase (DIM6/NTAB) family NADH-FMN oxidoreductase RutF